MLKFYTAVIQPIFYINRLEIIMSDNTDYNNNSEYSTVTLSLDDGSEVECAVIRTFPAGDKNYIALLPIADIDEDESEVYLYRYSISADNEPVLENIDSDEEYEIVSDAFDEELDAMKNSMSRKTLKINLTYEFVE